MLQFICSHSNDVVLKITCCAVNHFLWLHVLIPQVFAAPSLKLWSASDKASACKAGPLLCLVFHVLIPPAPFSAVAKKGVTIKLHSVIISVLYR